MKIGFRDFYYLDSDYVDNLSGYIEGFIEEEYSKVEKEEKAHTGKGKAGMGILGTEIVRDIKTGKEISRKGRVNSELRYKKLFDYLKVEGLEQIEVLDAQLWNMMIKEDEIFELRGSLHFTQVYELEQQAQLIGSIGSGFGFIDEKEVKDVSNQIAKLRELQEKNGIPIRLVTLDSKYNFVAYLNDKFLIKEQSDITGNNYKMLCKIERIIPDGEIFELFDLEELERKLTNRAERRKNKSSVSMPKEFKESVVGPAAIVLPIAIYR